MYTFPKVQKAHSYTVKLIVVVLRAAKSLRFYFPCTPAGWPATVSLRTLVEDMRLPGQRQTLHYSGYSRLRVLHAWAGAPCLVIAVVLGLCNVSACLC